MTQNDPVLSAPNSNDFIHSLCDPPSPQLISQSSSIHESESFSSIHTNTFTPHYRNEHHETSDKLMSQMEHIRDRSSDRTIQYERAIRRALLENDYMRKINIRLVAKLASYEHELEGDAVKSSLQRLNSAVEESKSFMRDIKSNQYAPQMEGTEPSEEISTEIEKLTIENSGLRAEVVQLKEKLQDAMDRDALVMQLEDVAAEKETADLKALMKMEEISTLKEELNYISEKLEQNKTDISTANDEANELKIALDLAREELKRSEELAASLESQLAHETEEKLKLQQCAQDLDANLWKIVMEHHDEPSELSELCQGDTDDDDATSSEHQNDRKNDAEVAQSPSSDVVAPMSKPTEHHIDVNINQTPTLMALSTTFQSLQSKITQLEQSLQRQQTKVETQRTEMKVVEMAMKNKVDALDMQLQEKCERVSILESENESLSHNLKLLTVEMEGKTTTTNEQLDEGDSNTAQVIENLQIQLSKSLAQESKMSEEMSLLEERNAELVKKLESDEEEDEELCKTIMLLNEELREALKQLTADVSG